MNKNLNENEFDMFELFKNLWIRKRVIGVFTFFSALVGLTLALFDNPEPFTPSYKISAPYSVNIYSVVVLQLCRTDPKTTNCADVLMKKELLHLADKVWAPSARDLKLVHETKQPFEAPHYQKLLHTYNKKLTENILLEAKRELNLISNESDGLFLQSETASANELNSRRVIQLINEEEMALRFGDLNFDEANHSIEFFIKIILSTILGFLVSVWYIIFRNKLMKII